MDIIDYTKQKILSLCNEQNITVKQLAKQSGIPISTIENLFTGLSKNPGIATLERICKGLKISMSDFFIKY